MALLITSQAPSLCIRRAAYEQSGLTRAAIDARLGLTPEEFRVEGDLIIVGPIHGVSLNDLFEDFERAGLRYYDDYFELSGNWPNWLQLYAAIA
jgi:hypothetical protein